MPTFPLARMIHRCQHGARGHESEKRMKRDVALAAALLAGAAAPNVGHPSPMAATTDSGRAVF